MAAICLVLACFFAVGCGRPSPDSTVSPSATPAGIPVVIGVVLQADPNPVPGGTEKGKTTITWQTGSEAVADIYYVDGTEETLFGERRQRFQRGALYPAGVYRISALQPRPAQACHETGSNDAMTLGITPCGRG